MKDRKRNRDMAEIINDRLSHGFPWEDTKEGRAFWEDVSARLDRIARDGE
jgi:hypothetical protein